MKHFESFLAEQMKEFLKYRLNMGYSEKYQLSILRMFDQYVKRTKLEPGRLSPEFFLTMRSSLKMDPVSVNSVICMARGFFNFMVRKGYYDKNPVRDVPFLRKNVVAPFIFSPQQTDRLIAELCKNIRKKPSQLSERSYHLHSHTAFGTLRHAHIRTASFAYRALSA